MTPVRVILIDDHCVVREGIKALIHAESDMRVVAEGSDGTMAEPLVRQWHPQIVILDLVMPVMDGVAAAQILRASHPDVQILVLSAANDPCQFQRLLELGISGYMLKLAAADALIQAIRTIAGGGMYLDPAVAQSFFCAQHTAVLAGSVGSLSERERHALQLIAQGYSNKEIAEMMHISVKTVETYKSRAMEKLDVHNRVELVRYAARQGWLEY